MITIDEALAKILETCRPLPPERVRLLDSLNRVLASDVFATEDLPGFDASAADGYAVRTVDLQEASSEKPVVLRLQETVAAGSRTLVRLAAGATARILTGAPVPSGADFVVMQEIVEALPGEVRFFAPGSVGENIRTRGSELRTGALVLPAGLPVSPAGVAMLATLGIEVIDVHRRPRIAVIATGSELVAPGQQLLPGQIRDSNSFGLMAAVKALGLEAVRVATVPDDVAAIEHEARSALDEADVLLITGGVSVGDRDYVKEAASSLGVEKIFWRISIKPGKPNFFGVRSNRYVFGLPGNPVAALVSFYLLVRPAIARLMGLQQVLPLRTTALLRSELRKKPGRAEFVRAQITREGDHWMAWPLRAQDSSMMSGLAQATALIVFPLEAEYLPAGTVVDVIPLDWNELR